jgi:HTH-type transcriptional regulator/antitoxin HigA
MTIEIDDFSVMPSANSVEIYEKFQGYVDDVLGGKIGELDGEKVFSLREYIRNSHGDTLYRKSEAGDGYKKLVWMSRVKSIANYFCSVNEMNPFEGLDKGFLNALVGKSQNVQEIKNVAGYLSEVGILFFIEPNLQGAKIDGVCFKSASGNPVIVMSLRYSRVDNFWFTLLHELSHVFLHIDQLDVGIIDDLDENQESLIEKQANKLARDALIPRSKFRWCVARDSHKSQDVINFSKEIGVHPAVVAGRLRHELERYDLFTDIINVHDVREYLLNE